MNKIKNILTRRSLLNIVNKIQPIKKFSFKILSYENKNIMNIYKINRMNFSSTSENTNKNADSNVNKDEGKQELNKEKDQKVDGIIITFSIISLISFFLI
jgi:hypothetical protein